ncbi:MAG: hypothetical protein CALGDGBN_03112 [Pseudomonadales bacterium]|nr:hypothetical protein [Pseudomonadales bacterium]
MKRITSFVRAAALREDLLAQARTMGSAVERLIWVGHGRAGAR